MGRKKRELTNIKANYMLYIIQNGEFDQYKIGITNNINRRYSELQVGNPNELKLVKVWTHYHKTRIIKYEKVLHSYFKKWKIRDNGEWYKLNSKQLKMLCKPNGTKEQNQLINEILEKIKK